MDDLAELIRTYKTAKALEEQLRIAEVIIKLISPKLESHLLRIYYQPDFVADALQDALIKIFQNLHKCRAESENQSWSWCYSIARHTLIDHQRRTKRTENLDLLDSKELSKALEAAGQKEPISAAERVDLNLAWSLVQSAKPECRRLLWLRYFLGMALTEMAKTDDIDEDAMRMRVNRCLKAVIDGLEGGT
jgi:RNA polymerase sigma factor (sigma-70 family)